MVVTDKYCGGGDREWRYTKKNHKLIKIIGDFTTELQHLENQNYAVNGMLISQAVIFQSESIPGGCFLFSQKLSESCQNKLLSTM